MLNIIHAIYVYIVYPEKIIKYMFMGNKILFIIAIVLMIITIIYSSCGVMDIGCLLTPCIIGYGIFVFLFYKYKPTDHEFPEYFNPFSIISLIGSISLGIFVCSTFVIQLNIVMSGYTTKQTYSINKEYLQRQEENKEQIDDEYIRAKTFKEKLNNLIYFLKRVKPESLINPKRDL